jgi:HEAT repeat protein
LSRQGKAAVRWDTTTHLEGVGQLPTDTKKPPSKSEQNNTVTELLDMLYDDDPKTIVSALNLLPRDLWEEDRREVIRSVSKLALSEDSAIRSAVARSVGFLQWKELVPWHFRLLQDRDWLVRSNAARALLKRADRDVLLEQAYFEGDPYICEILTKSIEQDQLFQQEIFRYLADPRLKHTRISLFASEMIRHNYEIYEQTSDQAKA